MLVFFPLLHIMLLFVHEKISGKLQCTKSTPKGVILNISFMSLMKS